MYNMNELIKDKVFFYFNEISKIPHGSTNEKALSDYIVSFAKERNFYVRQDEKLNVIVKKPASKGKENLEPVILQGHIDMVCEKNFDKDFDFLKDSIELIVNGNFLYANKTTLGADDGIAVAYMMAILDDDKLSHPLIEMIFTTEEEIGMGGAHNLSFHDIRGRRLINLDAEEEGVFLSGCSGGIRANINLPIRRIDKDASDILLLLNISGLLGGHSGADIHLQRANANKLMTRILYRLDKEIGIKLVHINGGSMDNAICREATGCFYIEQDKAEVVEKIIKEFIDVFKNEYICIEDTINISIDRFYSDYTMKPMEKKNQVDLLVLLMNLAHGVLSMDNILNNLVETSNNIGIVKTDDDFVYIINAVRSSVESKKRYVCDIIESLALNCGAGVEFNNNYPGWKYEKESELREIFIEAYIKLYNKEPKVKAIHAGLECGLFSDKVRGLDMISLGPEIYDVHTPKERIVIPSVKRVYQFLTKVLEKIE